MGNFISGLIFILLLSGCSVSSTKISRQPANYNLPLNLIWPMQIKKISRYFNEVRSGYHDGVDIPAPTGTTIRAAESGRVIYSGKVFKGYGKMILIEHTRGLATLYAHCSKLLVKNGTYVDKGQIIALVGRTGRASAPHLHFEVRLNKKPVDPMEFLP